MRKDAYFAVGGYPPLVERASPDFRLALRLARIGRVRFAPTMVCYTSNRRFSRVNPLWSPSRRCVTGSTWRPAGTGSRATATGPSSPSVGGAVAAVRPRAGQACVLCVTHVGSFDPLFVVRASRRWRMKAVFQVDERYPFLGFLYHAVWRFRVTQDPERRRILNPQTMDMLVRYLQRGSVMIFAEGHRFWERRLYPGGRPGRPPVRGTDRPGEIGKRLRLPPGGRA